MKQLIQNFKTGKLYVDEIPQPSLSKGLVLVENDYSLISAGTERSTVKVAQASLLGKARERPDLVAQVWQNVKKEGLSATLQKVKTKLDTLKALGYSTSGTVVATMDTNGMYQPGDRVACAGQDYASHAELVAVPQNLTARIPDNVSSEEAAFTTLGAIALQGIRQTEPRLGERIAVIGLGLLGQLTCQLLRANGCSVFGIDLSDRLVGLAEEMGADKALRRDSPNLASALDHFTGGHGFDAVIITAAAPSNDPIELAAEITRKKGRVVVVGAVKMDIPRDPHFYRHELELRMSCSYGPGRYDESYEERGIDYPYAYVRWTEQRNMEAFLELLSKKAVRIEPLITHVFDIAEAEKAYDIITGKTPEPHIGILLRYPPRPEKRVATVVVANRPPVPLNVGFIGAGSFAQSYLIPSVKAFPASLDTVVTARGISAGNVAAKFGFNRSSTDPAEILTSDRIDTVFIATPHDSHAELALMALQAGKNVFVEKPLAINPAQLQAVISARSRSGAALTVGFNRRFAPACVAIKKAFTGTEEPLVIHVRVNAGFIPREHWTQVPEIGAGRVIGEMCHFIDLMQYFTDAEPTKVYADCIATPNHRLTPEDNISVTVKFSDGSVGSLVYLASGDKALPKEHIEVFGAGKTAVIEDFRRAYLYQKGRRTPLPCSGKGHKEEIQAFLGGLKEGKEAPIPFRSLCLTTLTTFSILDSLHTGLPQNIAWND